MARTCTIEGCDNALRAIGLCSSHWKMNKKFGTPRPVCHCGRPTQTRGPFPPSVLCSKCRFIKRLWEPVQIRPEGCWEWSARKTKAGYGVLGHGLKVVYAHRSVYEAFHGKEIPEEMYICHKCDNPSCVRPDHLFMGTPQDNAMDMVNKGRHGGGRSKEKA